jgi:glycosyl transferase, family 25
MLTLLSENEFDAQFDCFVISLERQPERLKAFYERNQSSGIEFRHFKAIDGTQCSDAVAKEILAEGVSNYRVGQIGLAMSHLTLWRLCVKQNKPFLVFEDDAVIRQDFKSQFTPLTRQLANWDFILLGYNTDSVLELSMSPGVDFGGVFSVHFPGLSGAFSVRYPTAKHLAEFATAKNPVGLARLSVALGTAGCAITPKGAERLIQCCFPLDNRQVHLRCIDRTFAAYGIDCMLATVYSTISAFVCVPPLVMTANDPKKSTIQGTPVLRRWR